ncbi:MAG: hypothetical protein KF721_14425 [Ignavibacteriaceae bacterium]|nr:hypothetical protein [Ignavibacteriaceae bacterium]
MDNKKIKILQYLTDELSVEESKSFEQEMNDSAELKMLVESYNKKLSSLSTLRNIKGDERYFVNIFPIFSQKLAEKVQKLSIGNLSFAFSFVVVLLILVSIGIKSGLDSDFQERVSFASISDDAMNYLNMNGNKFTLNDLQLEFESIDENEMSETFIQLLKIESKEIHNYVNPDNLEIIGTFDKLNSEEFDNLYKSLSETKIL